MHLGGLAPSASHESPDIDPKSSHLPDEHIGSKFHNSGGECLLFQPHVIVTGHHQPAGVIGLRTAMVRMAGWTLQLVVIYLDFNFEIGQGPNKERTEQALQCVMAAKVPWLIIGDFNRSPEEVANSAWCKFLRGVVLTPDVASLAPTRARPAFLLMILSLLPENLLPNFH